MNVTILGIDYECTKAVKGPDFVRLYQGDAVILSCMGIADFSGYVLTDGEWSDPDPDLSVISTGAELSSGSIVITSDKIIGTGTMLKFKAPCDCTAVTRGLVIDGKTYTIVDSLGNNVIGTGGMWASGAFVSVLIDKANRRAFIQNSAKPAVVLGIEDGGTGASTVEEVLYNLGLTEIKTIGAKIEFGSYVGTGTCGEEYPNTLTFGFVPKLLFILPDNRRANGSIPYPTVAANGNAYLYRNSNEPDRTSHLTWDGTSVSWHIEISNSIYSDYQFNSSNTIYYYCAIG